MVPILQRILLALSLVAFAISVLFGQRRQDSTYRFDILRAELSIDPKVDKIYKVNPWVSGGIALAGILTNDLGLRRLRDQPRLDQSTLDGLGEDDVPPIDRWALRQDVEKKKSAEEASDIGFRVGLLMPAMLFIDKRIRKDALDVALLFLETQSLSSNFYTWGPFGPTFVQRYRPVAWYDELSYDERSLGNVRNSFFSGHVSVTATGAYFAAKVFNDYHPEFNFGKKLLVYTIASLPPVWVGINRVRGLRHFPSDCLAGLAAGAFFGTIVPSIHKRWNLRHRSKLKLSGGVNGGGGTAGLSLTF
jgi:membrane-associated phospholipid phosphatase